MILRLLLFYVPISARNRSQRFARFQTIHWPSKELLFVVLPDLLPMEPPLLGSVPASPTLTQFASSDTDEID